MHQDGQVQFGRRPLSELVSRPVLIEDVRHAVLGDHGAPDLQPRSDLRSATPIDGDVLSAREVGRRPGTTDFLVWTVQLESQPVGRVWLAANGSGLTATDTRAVEHASIVLSLEIMRLRTARRAMTSVPEVVGATVAVSASGHRNYPEAYRTAGGALDIAARSGRTNITVTLEALRIAGPLLQLDDADQLLAFADRTLADSPSRGP